MKIGDRIMTPNGEGTIGAIEHYNRMDGGINRYGVKLDQSPYPYSPAYFFADEVSPLPDSRIQQSSTRADAGQLAAGASNEAQDACIGRAGHSLSRREST